MGRCSRITRRESIPGSAASSSFVNPVSGRYNSSACWFPKSIAGPVAVAQRTDVLCLAGALRHLPPASGSSTQFSILAVENMKKAVSRQLAIGHIGPMLVGEMEAGRPEVSRLQVGGIGVGVQSAQEISVISFFFFYSVSVYGSFCSLAQLV